MIVKENITVYICNHCKKRYFKKAACEKHEVICYSNPENFRACSDCNHLEEIKTSYEVDYRENPIPCKGFRCKKLDQMMYPFKVEKKGLVEKYPESFEGQVPMPKKCEHYNYFI